MKKLILFIPLFFACIDYQDINNVKIDGCMSDVMWQGKLDGIISKDKKIMGHVDGFEIDFQDILMSVSIGKSIK